eukprot:6710996-Prymnesium_polylepis.2
MPKRDQTAGVEGTASGSAGSKVAKDERKQKRKEEESRTVFSVIVITAKNKDVAGMSYIRLQGPTAEDEMLVKHIGSHGPQHTRKRV